jgi:hypothetical protein
LTPIFCLWVSLVHFFGPGAKTPNDQVAWLNAPGPEAGAKYTPRLDAALDASALSGGLVTAGRSRIEFRPSGEYVVEVFVIAQDPGRRSFLLEADKEVVDSNLRLRATGEPSPDAPVGYRTLVGIVHGPAELSVRSSAAEYAIAGIRWRTRDEYERDVVPVVVARARQLQADVNLLPNATERQRVLRQLWERAWLARDAKTATEAALGLTRAFYWEAMRYPDSSHRERLLELLQRAVRRAPNDELVHQIVSAACAGTNLPPSSAPPYDDYVCRDVKPVFWASRVRDRGTAPRWAETQRRLRIRLEDIASYWIDKRMKRDGSFGGAWLGEDAGTDAAMLRNWGPLAAGLGSDLAARGIDQLSTGLFKSRLMNNGYAQQMGPAEVSSKLSSGTLPYVALVRPDSTVSRLRETAQCLAYWIRKQDDGAFRFSREAYNCREFADSSHYVDTWRNLEAVGPALWYTAVTNNGATSGVRDEETITRLWYWAESWAKLMRSNDGGKVSGVIPEEMFSADGSYVIREGGWSPEGWSAEGQRAITWLFAALYDAKQEDGKGDKRWLAAAEEALAAQPPPELPPTETLTATDDDTAPDASAAKETEPPAPPAAHAMPVPKKQEEKKQDESLATRLRQRLANKRPLAELFEYGFEWDGGAQLTKLATDFETSLSSNFAMYTTEALFTDRVYYAIPEAYQQFLFGGAAPRPDRYPAFAISRTPAVDEYSHAVLSATDTALDLKFFNFEQAVVQANFRAWRLRPGRYQWTIAETKQQGEIQIEGARRYFSIPLAAGRELTVAIRRR